jgi:hypothetical protein
MLAITAVRGDDQQFDAHHADRFESHQRACLVTCFNQHCHKLHITAVDGHVIS